MAWALRRKGAEPTLWFTTDFPTQARESVSFGSTQEEALITLHDIDGHILCTDFKRLWNRRPREELAPAKLDPADKGFARVQCSRFRTALLNILTQRAMSAGCFCVNPWESALRAENKLWQHHMAAQVGLEMPQSLYSNDPERIRRFVATCGGEIVYKPFLGGLWNDGTTTLGCFTNAIREADLVEDELLQAVPGIYQELVPKAYELRVTMVGQRAFAARINSQQTTEGKLDWRRSYDDLTMEPWQIPEDLHLRCMELMRRLEIVFGCLDFIVTPEGRHVFLEVNQAGQFLFVEEYCGLPLLDAFSELLLQGRFDFVWNENEVAVRLSEIGTTTPTVVETEMSRHVRSQLPVAHESTPSLSLPQ